MVDGLEADVITDDIAKDVDREIGRLERTGGESMEANWIRTWLDTVFDIPWSERADTEPELDCARAVLDELALPATAAAVRLAPTGLEHREPFVGSGPDTLPFGQHREDLVSRRGEDVLRHVAGVRQLQEGDVEVPPEVELAVLQRSLRGEPLEDAASEPS